MKKLLVVLGCFWWGSSLSCEASPHFSEMEANKENVQGLSPQQEVQPINKIYTVEQILAEVNDAYTSADTSKLRVAYNHFKKVDLPEGIWQAYATQLKAESWPAQTTWKERVGAQVFFPFQALEWVDCPYRSHLVQRGDVIWGCYISAQFNHPLGKYLFAETLEKLNAPEPVIKSYYQRAISDLKQRLDHPDACYFLGKGLEDFPYPTLVYDTAKTFTCDSPLFSYHPDHLRNKYYDLDGKEQLTLSNCLDLACAGHYPAYLKAGELTQVVEKEEILKEAAAKRYSPALLELGYLYKKQGKGAQAEQCFMQAADHGLATGHIELGKLLIGDPKKVVINGISKEILEKAENHFREAGIAKDPKGWQALIDLLEKRLAFALEQKNQEDYNLQWGKLAFAIEDGLKLGLKRAFTKAQDYIDEPDLKKLTKIYGYPYIAD